MAEIKTLGARNGEFLTSEANGDRSRALVDLRIAADTKFESGTVLGQITSSGAYKRHDSDLSDGAETEAGVLLATAENTTDSAITVQGVVVVRDVEVKGDLLIYEDGADAAAKTATNTALEALNIIVR